MSFDIKRRGNPALRSDAFGLLEKHLAVSLGLLMSSGLYAPCRTLATDNRRSEPTKPGVIASAGKDLNQNAVPDLWKKLKIVERYEAQLPKDVIGSATTTAAVQPYAGVPALHINGRPVFPMAMIPIGHFPTNVCRDFAAAGLHLYSHIIWTWGPRCTPDVNWWLGSGQYDFAKVDAMIRAILDADPQAYIFLRLKLDAPTWWLQANRDELAYKADGQAAEQASMASERWEDLYERMLRDLIRHIENSPYSGHIIGYQPAGGYSSEWYWDGAVGPQFGWIDYGPAALRRFRKWLKER
ncbi:MAG: hypothetical protein N3B01_02965 [Verrucomicrobiae bacterium]|nr:hypothetical protein [Verrucomicrobiae bacterium]